MKIEITSSERTILLSALVRREIELQSLLSSTAVKADPESSKSILKDLRATTQIIDYIGGLE